MATSQTYHPLPDPLGPNEDPNPTSVNIAEYQRLEQVRQDRERTDTQNSQEKKTTTKRGTVKN